MEFIEAQRRRRTVVRVVVVVEGAMRTHKLVALGIWPLTTHAYASLSRLIYGGGGGAVMCVCWGGIPNGWLPLAFDRRLRMHPLLYMWLETAALLLPNIDFQEIFERGATDMPGVGGGGGGGYMP